MISRETFREIIKIPTRDYYDSIKILDSKPAPPRGTVYMVNAPMIGRFQVFMPDTSAADLYWKPYDFEKYTDVHEYSVKISVMSFIYENVDMTGIDENDGWYSFFWNEQERRRIPAKPDFRYIASPEQTEKKADGLSPEDRARLFGA